MKKLLITTLLTAFVCTAFAQSKEDSSEEKTGGFKKEYLFTGGTVNLSFSNYGTVLGASPQLGYSVTNWLDAGIIMGFTYSSQRDAYDYKYRQTLITPGAFARLFPFDFLFASVQYEHNFISQKVLIPSGGNYKEHFDANSLLLGIGYLGGKQGRNSPYYYFSVSVDILQNHNSPYTDQYNNLLPVVNAGFNIPLFGGGRRGY